MSFPSDVGVVDLMMGIPEGAKKDWYGFLRAGLMDDESKDDGVPRRSTCSRTCPKDIDAEADPVAVVLGEMDHFGIEKAMLGVTSSAAPPSGPSRSTPTGSSAPTR